MSIRVRARNKYSTELVQSRPCLANEPKLESDTTAGFELMAKAVQDSIRLDEAG